MGLLSIRKKYYISTVEGFVREFELEEWFVKTYKMEVDDWDNDVSDDEVIEKAILTAPKMRNRNFLLVYDENLYCNILYEL